MSVLGYWDIRGLAQPIRLLLEYAGEKYEEVRYSCGPAPDFDKSCWLDKKFKLGLDFPNLPYYVDGNIKITQSTAILRFLARKYDLLGKTEQERIRVDVLTEQSTDLKWAFYKLCYSPQFNEQKDEFISNLDKVLEEYSVYLGKNTWFAGDNLTFIDFVMYEVLDEHRELAPAKVDLFGNLVDFLSRFEELPAIEAYMKSSRFMKSPITNKMAQFGTK